MLCTSPRVVALAVVALSLSSVHAEPSTPLLVGRWTFVDILDNGLLPKEELQRRRQVSKALTATFEAGGRYLFFDQPMGTWTLDPDGKRVVVKLDMPGAPPGATQEMLIQSVDQKELVIVVGQLPHRMARFVPAAPPPPPAREPTVFEKVARTKLEPVKDVEARPASAYLHALWLGSAQVPALAERWASPYTGPGLLLSWGNRYLGNCQPFELITEPRTEGWPVIDFRCDPAAGQETSIDVYETYRTREQSASGVVTETTWQKKVRTDHIKFAASEAAVTIVVSAPLGHRDLKVGITRVVPSWDKARRVDDGEFVFVLRGNGYDLVRDLHQAYLKEAKRLADQWRKEAETTTNEDEREEALARFALLKPEEASVAVEYFKRKYGLVGADLKKLKSE